MVTVCITAYTKGRDNVITFRRTVLVYPRGDAPTKPEVKA
jgi:hypothetical protein